MRATPLCVGWESLFRSPPIILVNDYWLKWNSIRHAARLETSVWLCTCVLLVLASCNNLCPDKTGCWKLRNCAKIILKASAIRGGRRKNSQTNTRHLNRRACEVFVIQVWIVVSEWIGWGCRMCMLNYSLAFSTIMFGHIAGNFHAIGVLEWILNLFTSMTKFAKLHT